MNPVCGQAVDFQPKALRHVSSLHKRKAAHGSVGYMWVRLTLSAYKHYLETRVKVLRGVDVLHSDIS